MQSPQNMSFDLGTHWSIIITCHDDPSGLKPLDLTNAVITFRLGTSNTTLLVADNVSYGGVQVTNAAAGIANIVIDPTKQTRVSAASYQYTIRVQTQDGFVTDQAYGSISLKKTQFDNQVANT